MEAFGLTLGSLQNHQPLSTNMKSPVLLMGLIIGAIVVGVALQASHRLRLRNQHPIAVERIFGHKAFVVSRNDQLESGYIVPEPRSSIQFLNSVASNRGPEPSLPPHWIRMGNSYVVGPPQHDGTRPYKRTLQNL